MFQKGDFSQVDEKVFNEVFRELPHSKCDMAIVAASPFPGKKGHPFHTNYTVILAYTHISKQTLGMKKRF